MSNKIDEIKHKHTHGYYNPRGQDDVAHLLGEVERLTRALRAIRVQAYGCGYGSVMRMADEALGKVEP